MGNTEHPIAQTVNSKDTQEQEQIQRKKPKKIGLWLLARKASKDAERVDLRGQEKKLVASTKPSMREGKQVHSADPGALMYLPLGGSKSVRYVTFHPHTICGWYQQHIWTFSNLAQVSHSSRCGRCEHCSDDFPLHLPQHPLHRGQHQQQPQQQQQQ